MRCACLTRRDSAEAATDAAGEAFGDYAARWLQQRELRPRTRGLYESLLRVHLLPTFEHLPLAGITRQDVRTWHERLDTGPTARANAYGLLRTIMGDAVDAELLPANPVQVKRARTKKRARQLRVLEPAELRTIVDNLPDRYRAFALLGAWAALRFGELAALRRRDLDLDRMVVHVRRAVSRVEGQDVVGPPKADSVRGVDLPPRPALVDALRHHLDTYAQPGRDGLVFPPRYTVPGGSAFLAPSTLHRVWKPAIEAAGRPDVRVHDLRHYGLVMAARAGATLGELQQRAGHSTAQAALVYQSAASERHADIARRMAELDD